MRGESPRSKKRRERQERIQRERNDLEQFKSNFPFGKDRRFVQAPDPMPSPPSNHHSNKFLDPMNDTAVEKKVTLSPNRKFSEMPNQIKITNLHQQVTEDEAVDQYNQKQRYKQILEQQVLEKKEKEKMIKDKQN